MEYVHETLRRDKEIGLLAVKNTPDAFKFLANELRADFDISSK